MPKIDKAQPAPTQPAPPANAGQYARVTHPHDIERLMRLGMASDADVARWRAAGLLAEEGATDANVVAVDPSEVG